MEKKDDRPTKIKYWNAKRKTEVVRKLLRGESIDAMSREYGIATYRLDEWYRKALSNIEEGFKEKSSTPENKELSRAKRQIGELSMENELLKERIFKTSPLVSRRLKR